MNLEQTNKVIPDTDNVILIPDTVGRDWRDLMLTEGCVIETLTYLGDTTQKNDALDLMG